VAIVVHTQIRVGRSCRALGSTCLRTDHWNIELVSISTVYRSGRLLLDVAIVIDVAATNVCWNYGSTDRKIQFVDAETIACATGLR